MKAPKGRPWKPGQSGNPAGRKPGEGPTAKLRASINKQVPDILEKLQALALAGDVQAARLLLERVLPPIKPVELPTPLVLPDGTLTSQGIAILQAIARGELAPGQGATLLSAVSSLARLAELAELEARIKALEARGSMQEMQQSVLNAIARKHAAGNP